MNPHMLQVRKEYIKFGLAKWGLLFVERGVKIAVVPRVVVGPTRHGLSVRPNRRTHLCLLYCSQESMGFGYI